MVQLESCMQKGAVPGWNQSQHQISSLSYWSWPFSSVPSLYTQNHSWALLQRGKRTQRLILESLYMLPPSGLCFLHAYFFPKTLASGTVPWLSTPYTSLVDFQF